MTLPDLIEIRDLGRISYQDAWGAQKELHEKVLAGMSPPTLLLVEHDPVITITGRDSAAGNLRASRALLEQMGIALEATDRGGDITYHGPGQVVVYPIVPLGALGLNVRRYVAALEDGVIDTLATFGVRGRRDPAGVGVWVDRPGRPPLEDSEPAKIAAVGVRVRRWVTMHGVALNVTTNLDHFRLIVPCGLTRPVTSLQQLLGERCPPMEHVKRMVSAALTARLTSGRCPTL